MNTALVLEDVPATSEWLADSLREAFAGITIRKAFGIVEAREQLNRHGAPDIALIDLGLPDGDGTVILKQLADSDCTAVVTTTFADDAHVFGALQAGAQGYLLKDASRAEIGQLLAGVAQGRPPLSPAIARRVLAYFGQAAVGQPVSKPAGLRQAAAEEIHLSRRESETLELIAKGYTVANVAKALGVSPNTTAGYVKNIYRKLNVSSRAEAATQAAHLGLLG